MRTSFLLTGYAWYWTIIAEFVEFNTILSPYAGKWIKGRSIGQQLFLNKQYHDFLIIHPFIKIFLFCWLLLPWTERCVCESIGPIVLHFYARRGRIWKQTNCGEDGNHGKRILFADKWLLFYDYLLLFFFPFIFIHQRSFFLQVPSKSMNSDV